MEGGERWEKRRIYKMRIRNSMEGGEIPWKEEKFHGRRGKKEEEKNL